MGGILTSGTDANLGYACITDDNCYEYVNTAGVTATTDAEKAKRCCFHTKANTIANYPLGLTMAELYGWP